MPEGVQNSTDSHNEVGLQSRPGSFASSRLGREIVKPTGAEDMGKSVKIDFKGRLRIPANALSALGNCTEFFITSQDGKSARVYPLTVWKEVEKWLASARLHNNNKQKLLTRAKYFGQAVTMDNQGRVLIPIVLRETAHIEGEVDVLGSSKYLEVWNHTSFLRNLKRSSTTARDEVTMDRMLYN
jgi:MraZ protein